MSSHAAEAGLPDGFARVHEAVLTSLEVYDTRRDPNELDYLIYLVSKLYRLVQSMSTSTDEVLEAMAISLSIFEDFQLSSVMLPGAGPERSLRAAVHVWGVCSGRYEAQVLDIDDRVGRPRLDIPKEQLEYLLAIGFSGPQISNAIGASLSTIRRRMTQYGLTVGSLYSDVSDQELDSIVSRIKILFPNCGFRMMQGHLLTQGHRVSQARVRESLQRIDPDGVAIRWSATIERRTYKVQSPLSLWHIDGNHKLIRYVIMLHGLANSTDVQ